MADSKIQSWESTKIVAKHGKVLYSTANDPETANDPQNGPQIILDRKWSPKSTANDPERKIGMAWTNRVNFIIITKSQTESEILFLK